MADEFEKEEYGDAKSGIEDSAIQARISELVKTPSCSLSECTAKVVEPAEEAWLRLMSAVPMKGQTANIRPARDIQSYALPNGESVASLVASVRPSPADEYSIEKISDEWQTFYSEFYNVPEDLKAGLSTLSEDWEGDDYDAFEEQVEKVIKNCRTILDDVWGDDGGAVKVLNDKADEIFSQQGGNECVYPAPKFHLEDAAACSHKIHIRPAYFQSCEVFADDETKTAMEWAGFDSSIIDDIENDRDELYQNALQYATDYPDAYVVGGRTPSQYAQETTDEWVKRQTDHLGTDGQEDLQEQATIVNGDIMDRKTNANVQVSEIDTQAKNSEQTAFNDGDVPPTPDLDGGSPPGGGTPPGLGDMTPPGSTKPMNPPSLPPGPGDFDSNNPNLPSNPNYPGGTNLPDPNGLDDNPWESSTPDPDDISGGLASGGGLSGGGLGGGGLPGGGGPGGGLGGGAGAGGGLGGGMGAGMGGMMGGAGGGRGAGAGAGGGRGAGGRGAGGPKGMGKGMGGGMGGMMGGAGGGRGMGGQGEGEQEAGTWLTEDDDVWGIGNEEEDPYA